MPILDEIAGVNVGAGLVAPQLAKVKKDPRYLLGGDPEVFVKSKITGKIITSEAASIGGQKGHGIPFGPTGRRFKILEDNVAVELNFAPKDDFYSFCENIENLKYALREHLAASGLESIPVPQYEFTAEQLATPKAQVFGCDPDFNAYDTSGDEPPPRVVDPVEIGNLRFCGGHLHFGFENPHDIPLPALVILIDMFIGLPSIAYDSQYERRKFYGMAGLYRPKKYGLEYRTMSNWWLREEQTSAAQNMFREAYQLMYTFTQRPNQLSYVFDRMPLKDVQVAINTENGRAAKEIWQEARGLAQEQDLPLGNFHFPRGF